MLRPGVVVFDLGKVLVDFDYEIAARQIAARSTMTLPKIQVFLNHSPVLLHYETGAITRREFFEIVRGTTGFSGSLENFVSFFSSVFTEITPMVELHSALRLRGIPTFAFSNTNDIAIEHIRRNFAFYREFDGHVLSYEVGAMKPDVKIYEALEEAAGRRGQEICYLDDRPENIASGSAREWQSVLHESPRTSLAAIRRFGLLD